MAVRLGAALPLSLPGAQGHASLLEDAACALNNVRRIRLEVKHDGIGSNHIPGPSFRLSCVYRNYCDRAHWTVPLVPGSREINQDMKVQDRCGCSLVVLGSTECREAARAHAMALRDRLWHHADRLLVQKPPLDDTTLTKAFESATSDDPFAAPSDPKKREGILQAIYASERALIQFVGALRAHPPMVQQTELWLRCLRQKVEPHARPPEGVNVDFWEAFKTAIMLLESLGTRETSYVPLALLNEPLAGRRGLPADAGYCYVEHYVHKQFRPVRDERMTKTLHVVLRIFFPAFIWVQTWVQEAFSRLVFAPLLGLAYEDFETPFDHQPRSYKISVTPSGGVRLMGGLVPRNFSRARFREDNARGMYYAGGPTGVYVYRRGQRMGYYEGLARRSSPINDRFWFRQWFREHFHVTGLWLAAAVLLVGALSFETMRLQFLGAAGTATLALITESRGYPFSEDNLPPRLVGLTLLFLGLLATWLGDPLSGILEGQLRDGQAGSPVAGLL